LPTSDSSGSLLNSNGHFDYAEANAPQYPAGNRNRSVGGSHWRIDLTASPYGVFMAGPSAKGDIEGVIIHGAQGARSLTVLLLAPAPG
jgi:hypothetical protein